METFVFTRKEAAQFARVSLPTLDKWIRLPGFPCIHAGRKALIPTESFKKWMNDQASHGGAK